MPLSLQSLIVKRCGPLAEAEIQFAPPDGQPRDVVVLAGPNGCGKTTVVELVAALMEMLHPAYKRTRPGHILDRTEYAQLNLRVDGTELALFYGHLPDTATLPTEHFGREIRGQGQPRKVVGGELAEALQENIRRQERIPLEFPAEAEQPLLLPNPSFPLPSVLYFPYHRQLLPVEGRQVQREDTFYQWVYRYEVGRSFGGSLESYLVWLDYADPTNFQRVREFVNRLALVGKTVDRVNRKALKTMVRLPDGTSHHLEELSSGEQNLLILLLEIRRRLLPGSLVLIDEIENSLHPAFQSHLVQTLRRLQVATPFQLVVTTHAPEMVEMLGEEATLRLGEF